MQALAAGTAALAVNNAANSLHNTDAFGNVHTAGNTGPNDLTNVTQTNAADQVGGISLNISIGTSKASSSSSQTVNTAKSSTLNAGGDIQIIATGAGKDSDINIIGSTIKAAHNVTIKAEDQITLQAAQNTSQLQSKNKSSSASVGVSVNLGAAGGVGVP